MNNLVAYESDLNTIPLRSFNSKEMDLFFSICSRLRNKGVDLVIFDFEELRDLSDYKYTAYDRFIGDIEGLYDKLIKLNMKIGSSEEFTKFVLFTKYTISAKTETVSIQVNSEFKYVLNELTGNFTKFELMEFTSLSSSYSKTAYRLLKQFRTTGYYIVKIDEFKRLFDVPASYQMSDMDKRIFVHLEKELPAFFENLRITKIKGKGKRKRYIEFIEFKFKPEIDFKDGVKTFRDKDTGEYYTKNILDFTPNEIDKTFPETKPISDSLELKDLMGLSKTKYKDNQINKIYNTAMQSILDSNSKVDVFEYIRHYHILSLSDKKIIDKFPFLINSLMVDSDNRLNQETLF